MGCVRLIWQSVGRAPERVWLTTGETTTRCCRHSNVSLSQNGCKFIHSSVHFRYPLLPEPRMSRRFMAAPQRHNVHPHTFSFTHVGRKVENPDGTHAENMQTPHTGITTSDHPENQPRKIFKQKYILLLVLHIITIIIISYCYLYHYHKRHTRVSPGYLHVFKISDSKSRQVNAIDVDELPPIDEVLRETLL